MTITIILLLSLCAALLWRRWRRLSGAVWTLNVFLVAGVGYGVIPAWALETLQSREAWEAVSAGSVSPSTDAKTQPGFVGRNVIVLLGAGVTQSETRDDLQPGIFGNSRVAAAAIAYRECRAHTEDCHILVSGGDPLHLGQAEAQVYAYSLMALGIPAHDLILETRSRNTFENARFTAEILREQAPARLWLVTSGVHMRRSLLYFGHFGLHPAALASEYVKAPRAWVPLGMNVMLSDIALAEWIGIGRYALYNAMGWNAPRVSPS